MFEKRKLIGLLDGVAWEMSSEEHEALNDHLNSSLDPSREAFAKLINCELSFESESAQNALENEVFSKEYLEENEPLKPDSIECYHFENSDDDRIDFSVKCVWDQVPINKKIKNQEDFDEAFEGWSSDLLDIFWLNDEGLELAPEIEEIGIDSKSISLE
tara:strand:- start:74 stop:550 length:477 start_codon:yes stop_codon:yes gene_type:complete